jgi:diguanylate cyclase (GGDEF)-like protein
MKISLLCFSAIVLALTFYINFTSRIYEFESEVKSREASVNTYIEQSRIFIDLLALYGNEYLSSGNAKDSEVFDLIRYDGEQNTFNMDAVRGTKYETSVGNLTGIGSIPKSGTYRDEINLALAYNQYFTKFHAAMREVTWLYYTSDSGFISMYPWISAEDFAYSDKLKSVPFFKIATPENNPLRQAAWTSVYMDEAGKGLMVTLSSPIYRQDTFRGVVSLDLTTERLGELMGAKYAGYMVDDRDYIVAVSPNAQFEAKKILFGDLLGLTPDRTEEMNHMPAGLIQVIGGSYVYRVNFENAPWRAYFSVSVWKVVGLSALFTLPVLACCIFLFYAFAESEKRRKTQLALSNTLDEIKSYHVLLENAAKHDFLTDTCNRRGLAEIYQERVGKAADRTSVAFIMGDIDEFKRFNDELGHTAGDRVLVELTRIMKESISENDVVCRWGGEEFVIMLLNTPFDTAMRIAETIRKRIAGTAIPWADSMELRATMTFGVAQLADSEEMQSCIARADSAMYTGKARGRNQVVGYDCQTVTL